MNRLLTILLAAGLVLGVAAAASANPIGIGARAVGMGGSFVAVADDGTAPAWNPAGITQLHVVSFTPTLSINGDFTIPDTSVIDEDAFPPDLGNLDLELDAMAGVLFKGVGISLLLNAWGETFYGDYGETGTYQASDGVTGVTGILMLTLAHDFGGIFAAGVNLKYLYGQEMAFFAENETIYGVASEMTTQGYAADLGFLLKLGEVVRLGVVCEDIYSDFESALDGYYFDGADWFWAGELPIEAELPEVLHLGAAFKLPVAGTLIAVQVDDVDADFENLEYRIGVEQSLVAIKLRGGAVLDEDFEAVWYTAGLGFKLGPVVCDAAVIADDDFEVDTFMLTAGFTF